jgi:ketosteroid isomerase-like protein
VSDESEILEAAERRAHALVDGDALALKDLLHPSFAWTSFSGRVFDRTSYIAANTGRNGLEWIGQRIESPEVVVAGDTALLLGVVVDEVRRDGIGETFRLRITQVWVRTSAGWVCLGGHAGPRLD